LTEGIADNMGKTVQLNQRNIFPAFLPLEIYAENSKIKIRKEIARPRTG
jgi:hypothetical protein